MDVFSISIKHIRAIDKTVVLSDGQVPEEFPLVLVFGSDPVFSTEERQELTFESKLNIAVANREKDKISEVLNGTRFYVCKGQPQQGSFVFLSLDGQLSATIEEDQFGTERYVLVGKLNQRFEGLKRRLVWDIIKLKKNEIPQGLVDISQVNNTSDPNTPAGSDSESFQQ